MAPKPNQAKSGVTGSVYTGVHLQVKKGPGTPMVVRGGSGTSHMGHGEAKGHAGFTKHTCKPC
jgi:hypothetical protein